MLNKKIKSINHELNKIKRMYKSHHKRWRKYKRLSTALKLVVNILNGVTVSSLIVSIVGISPILILTMITSSLSTLLTVIHDTVDMPRKISNHQTAYLQLLDLHRTYQNKMLSSNPDYSDILIELNCKIGLILDSAHVISISSSDSEPATPP